PPPPSLPPPVRTIDRPAGRVAGASRSRPGRVVPARPPATGGAARWRGAARPGPPGRLTSGAPAFRRTRDGSALLGRATLRIYAGCGTPGRVNRPSRGGG